MQENRENYYLPVSGLEGANLPLMEHNTFERKMVPRWDGKIPLTIFQEAPAWLQFSPVKNGSALWNRN